MLKYIVGKIFQIYKQKCPPTRIFDNKVFSTRGIFAKKREKRNVEEESSHAKFHLRHFTWLQLGVYRVYIVFINNR